ncbi:MAG TPA: hypothetical protein V6D09_26160 [Leptolyngbyaceae cyanobacterium]
MPSSTNTVQLSNTVKTVLNQNTKSNPRSKAFNTSALCYSSLTELYCILSDRADKGSVASGPALIDQVLAELAAELLNR